MFWTKSCFFYNLFLSICIKEITNLRCYEFNVEHHNFYIELWLRNSINFKWSNNSTQGMSWRYFIVVPYFYGGNLLQTDIHCTILHNNIYIHDCDMPISYFTAKPPTEMSNIKRNSAFTAACTMYSQSTFSQLSNKN